MAADLLRIIARKLIGKVMDSSGRGRSEVVDWASSSCCRRRSEEADWASLPQDLLRIIAMKLPAISDYVSFRSICTSWRSAASSTDLHPQLPWLILPSRGDEGSTLSFLNPSQSRVYNFHIPETRGKLVYGSQHGWLLMIDDKYMGPAVSLLNPITRSHIPLPPLKKRGSVLSQACLCFNPSSISEQLSQQELMAVIFSGRKLSFLRSGDDNWSEIDTSYHSAFASMANFEGKIHIVNRRRKLVVLDVASSKLVPKIKDAHSSAFEFIHLVKMEKNLIFIGWNRHSRINFFKLKRSMRGLKWVRVTDAVNDMTILTSPFQSIAVCSSDYLNDEGSQIYAFGDEYFHAAQKWDTKFAGVRSTTMQLPTRSKFSDWDMSALTWIVPSLY